MLQVLEPLGSPVERFCNVFQIGMDETEIYHTILMNGTIYFLNDKSIRSYSIITKRWFELSKLPMMRRDYGAVAYLSKLFIIGGWYPQMDGSSCIAFDPKTNTYQGITNMFDSRITSGCAVFNGCIVSSGGCYMETVNNTSQLKYRKTVEKYDYFSNEWSRMPDMLNERSGHALVAVKNKLYAIGGRLISGRSCRECEVYDNLSKKFVIVNHVFPLSEHIYNVPQWFTMGKSIAIFGPDYQIAVYDVEDDEWTHCDITQCESAPFCIKIPR